MVPSCGLLMILPSIIRLYSRQFIVGTLYWRRPVMSAPNVGQPPRPVTVKPMPGSSIDCGGTIVRLYVRWSTTAAANSWLSTVVRRIGTAVSISSVGYWQLNVSTKRRSDLKQARLLGANFAASVHAMHRPFLTLISRLKARQSRCRVRITNGRKRVGRKRALTANIGRNRVTLSGMRAPGYMGTGQSAA